jgi:hypothetical protein
MIRKKCAYSPGPCAKSGDGSVTQSVFLRQNRIVWASRVAYLHSENPALVWIAFRFRLEPRGDASTLPSALSLPSAWLVVRMIASNRLCLTSWWIVRVRLVGPQNAVPPSLRGDENRFGDDGIRRRQRFPGSCVARPIRTAFLARHAPFMLVCSWHGPYFPPSTTTAKIVLAPTSGSDPPYGSKTIRVMGCTSQIVGMSSRRSCGPGRPPVTWLMSKNSDPSISTGIGGS